MLRYTGPINRALVEQGVKRTSNLLAPIMLLEGHDGEIYCGKEAFIISKPLGKSSKFYQGFSKLKNQRKKSFRMTEKVLSLLVLIVI